MAKKNKKNKPPAKAKPQTEKQTFKAEPWIAMRTGVIIIAIISIVFAVLTGYQAYQSEKDLLDSILLGLAFGGGIWVIFFGNILINRFLRRK